MFKSMVIYCCAMQHVCRWWSKVSWCAHLKYKMNICVSLTRTLLFCRRSRLARAKFSLCHSKVIQSFLWIGIWGLVRRSLPGDAPRAAASSSFLLRGCVRAISTERRLRNTHRETEATQTANTSWGNFFCYNLIHLFPQNTELLIYLLLVFFFFWIVAS